ncbi:MAG: hypothetical protein RIT45_2636 [Pseudomonadota bacterium]|jgi:ATP-dependent Lhr-like helicase
MEQATAAFHPATRAWWERRFGQPTEAQRGAWPAWQQGRDVLVSAPTGSGKTLAAFLAAIDALVHEAAAGTLVDALRVVYVSPLKALGNDVERNLRGPLDGISAALRAQQPGAPAIRVGVRSGDTPASERRSQVTRPPHLLVTTPESLYLLLTSASGRAALATVETVIIDEIHAMAGDRRGSHLALSLARLDALCPRPVRRVGLSATARPLETMARLLVGADADRVQACVRVQAPSRRGLDAAIVVPGSPLEAVLAAEVRKEMVRAIADLVRTHGQTLVFVGTRRMAERYAAEIEAALREAPLPEGWPEDESAPLAQPHHGSLSRKLRHRTESALRDGSLRVCVATASLELGIDIGAVDLVVQIGSPRSAAVLLQRAGRSRHQVGGTPKVRLFPTTVDELVETAALLAVIEGRLQTPAGALEATWLEDAPLDVLAQQLVAECAQRPWHEDALFRLVRSAAPYAALPRERFDAVLDMLGDGIAARRGRRAAWLHRDRVAGEARGRRGAGLVALTSGGAIPEAASYDVVLHGNEQKIGTLHEDFAIESTPGDVFVLGSQPWRIVQVQPGRVRVEAAPGMQPSLPFWFGEGPGRTDVASAAVRALQARLVEVFEADGGTRAAVGTAWLREQLGLDAAAADTIATHLFAAWKGLGALPAEDTLILERFFDRSGGMQLVLHSPYGSRINRAFGLALRKRFCRRFNFELQAAATDDAILLSLGETHAFPLDEVWDYLRPENVRDVLVQAVLASPLFTTRWRWSAGRALAVPRFRGGRKLPPNLQRMDAEDLIAVVFPDQIACAENLAGPREIPDHPLVDAAMADTLHEAMDLGGLVALLRRLHAPEGAPDRLRRVCVDAREPSALAVGVVNAAVYAFLDDAPLEERRAAAVAARNWRAAGDDITALGHLDAAAIARVRAELRPDPRDAAELHDVLDVSGWLETDDLADVAADDIETLLRAGKAAWFDGGGARLLVAAERAAWVRRALPLRTGGASLGELRRPGAVPEAPEEALRELLRARLGCEGPVAASALAGRLGTDVDRVDAALHALEGEGFCLRGAFDPAIETQHWCERRVLGRIHRATLDGLRRAVAAVPLDAFVRFLRRWQGVGLPAAEQRAATRESVELVLRQLAGWQAPLAAWEDEILPARLAGYDPATLDALTLSGRFVWARLDVPLARGGSGPARTTPIALVPRPDLPDTLVLSRAHARPLSGEAARVLDALDGGPAFADDLARALRLPETRVEAALAELAAAGRARSDAIGGLRAMLRKPGGRQHPRRGRAASLDLVGRWSRIDRPLLGEDASDGASGAPDDAIGEDAVAAAARVLLGRWGVLCRRVLERESLAPPWRLLLRALWRMEARGEVRGGRFVAGLSGEQFALPDAIPLLRACRDAPDDPRTAEIAVIAAADPLNLAGWLLDGPRVAAVPDHRVALGPHGVVATRAGGETWFRDADPAVAALDVGARWTLEKALARHAGHTQPMTLTTLRDGGEAAGAKGPAHASRAPRARSGPLATAAD